MITFSILAQQYRYIIYYCRLVFASKSVIIIILIFFQNPAGGETPVTPNIKPVHSPGQSPKVSPVHNSPEKPAPGTGGEIDDKKVCTSIQA